MIERDRCLEALSYTWLCPTCRTMQADTERTPDGDCQTCVATAGWLARYDRALQLQRRGRWRNDPGVSVSETVVARETERDDCVPAVRLAACADHARAERAPVDRRPGSTRAKTYRQQVWETAWVSLAFAGLALIYGWIRAWRL